MINNTRKLLNPLQILPLLILFGCSSEEDPAALYLISGISDFDLIGQVLEVRTSYVYDDQYLLLHNEITDASGAVTGYEYYDYDESGLLISRRVYGSDGLLTEAWANFSYDDDDNVLSCTVEDSMEQILGEMTWTYSGDGVWTRTDFVSESDTLSYYYGFFERDGNGYIVKMSRFRNDSQIEGHREIEYQEMSD